MDQTVKRFEDVDVLLAETDAPLFTVLTAKLAQAGYTRVRTVSTLEAVKEALNAGGVDLLIANTHMEDGAINAILRDVRHGRIGDNPFLCAVALLTETRQDTVRQAIDAGFDDLHALPLNAPQFMDRLGALSRNRRPFVVTSDYIGPDRRAKPRPGTMHVPSVKVPNPIALRAGGQSRARMDKLNQQIYAAINSQKVDRLIYQLGWLKDKLEPRVSNPTADQEPECRALLKQLVRVALEAKERIGDTALRHMKAQCMTLSTQTVQLLAAAAPATDARWPLVLRLIDTITPALEQRESA